METEKYQIIRQWSELLNNGTITQEEFQAKKDEILSKKAESTYAEYLKNKNLSKPPKYSNNSSPNKIYLIFFLLIIFGGISYYGYIYFIQKPQHELSHQNNIESFLMAEENRNIEEIMEYFSPEITRYWNLQNPNNQQLKNIYKKSWENLLNSKNHINRIEKINENTYDLYTNFKYTLKSNNKKKEKFSIVRFKFDNDGKIIQIYEIE